MRVSEELGAHWHLPFYEAYLAMERFLAGGWDDASAELDAALQLVAATGERHSLVLIESLSSLIALHRAISGTPRRPSPGPSTSWPTPAPLPQPLGDVGPGPGPGGRGRHRAGVRRLAGCWDLCADAGFAIEYPVLGPDLVRLALASGERARAEQVAAAVADVAARNDVPSIAGSALRCRGLVEGDLALLRSAVDAYAQGPRPLELALAAEDAGVACARHGEVDSAVPLLAQALAGYESLEAGRDTARAEARLRDLGVRRGRRGARRRPPTGWESLTRTEHRVVDLVVEGLSNPKIGERLFISRRTVQTHLAHVFTKLGISSRTQLAAEATRRRPAP
jgi:DNA-binding CsgD family transcriptional regulator